jgi:hypothetical protein
MYLIMSKKWPISVESHSLVQNEPLHQPDAIDRMAITASGEMMGDMFGARLIPY